MARKKSGPAVVVVLMLATSGCTQANPPREFPRVREDYFGEPLPGDVPRIFAPGIASTDLHDDWPPIFTPDGNECLLRVVGPTDGGRIVARILRSVRGPDGWEPPTPLWFSNEFLDVEGFLALSPDGARLFVSTARGESNTDSKDPDRDIWIFERDGDEWVRPVEAGPFVNSDLHDLVTSVGTDGTLYFDREPRDGEWFSRSYFAKPDGAGGFLEPEELKIPGPEGFGKVLVARDGSYLVLTGRHPTRSLDLYVSFRLPDGSWGEPVNLESINSPRSDKLPGLSPDGRYLFFASRRTPADRTPPRFWDAQGLLPAPPGNQVDVYWVSTAVIERSRPD